MKVGIIGTGAYAIALSHLLNKEVNITMWTKFVDEKEMIMANRENINTLPGYKIKENIIITNNLSECLVDKELIIIAIPSQFLTDLYDEMNKYINDKQIICIASKGIDKEGFNSNIIKKHINNQNILVISGPTFAVDIVKDIPIGLTIATNNIENYEILKKYFTNKNLTLEYTKDSNGIELCGAIKNIYAIGMGILTELNFPISTKALYLTKALKEIENILEYTNCSKDTISTLAGFGDLYLTCNSVNSRNFTFGTMIAKGNFKAYLENNTVEGVHALDIIYNYILKDNCTPIINSLYSIVYKNNNTQDLINTIKEY